MNKQQQLDLMNALIRDLDKVARRAYTLTRQQVAILIEQFIDALLVHAGVAGDLKYTLMAARTVVHLFTQLEGARNVGSQDPLINYPPFKDAHEALHRVWSKTGTPGKCSSAKCLSCGSSYDKQEWKALEKAIEDLGRIARAGDEVE
jgi:hypothetical protein